MSTGRLSGVTPNPDLIRRHTQAIRKIRLILGMNAERRALLEPHLDDFVVLLATRCYDLDGIAN